MARRTKEEALETRHQIIDAAEQCFYDKGVSRTSLAEIAATAGVSRGAIYWHFENKGQLLQALLEHMQVPFEALGEASRSASEPDPLGLLRQLLIQVFQSVACDPMTRRINEIILHKCEYTDDLCDLRQHMHASHLETEKRVEATLINAIAKQQLPVDLDVHLASICLLGYVHGLLSRWLLLPAHLDLHGEAERLADAGLDQLRLSPALRKP